MTISPKHLDLLLSRLFHDLIGPVSASRNGMELVREFGAEDVGAEAMDLVATSVEQAAARLTFFRMAFGGAGSAGGISFLDLRPVVADYLTHRKLEPRVTVTGDVAVPRPGVVKVALGLVVVAAESLPRGGLVSLTAGNEEVVVTADGEEARVGPTTLAALAGEVEADNEVTVVPASVGISARRFDISVEVAEQKPPKLVARY